MYPTITQYISAISIPESFAAKTTLKPVLKDDGTPYFSSGGYAVVFKMECTETHKSFALKCFLKEHRAESFRKISDYLTTLNTPYLLPYEYLENELWVEDADFPVLLMEWVEGESLNEYLADLCLRDDNEGIAQLAGSFDALGLWLLEQELAHGDLKPDNIIVRNTGQIVLIDYDGLFVPTMTGEESRELGTQDWRHPQRKYSDFNRHLDDFSVLVISLSLHIFKASPDLSKHNSQTDNLLFTEADYLNPYQSAAFSQARNWQSHEDIAPRLALLQYAVSIPVLQLIGLDVHLKRTAVEYVEYEADDSFEIVWDRGFCGFRNSKGFMITEYKYDDAKMFVNGLAVVQLNGKYGYIDKNGKEISDLIYEDIKVLSYELIGIKLNEKWGVIDISGKVKVPLDYDYLASSYQDLVCVRLNGKYGFVDLNGQVIIQIIYDWVYVFEEGLCHVSLNNKYGFIDNTGKVVVPIVYDHSFPFTWYFKNGLAPVCSNKKYGYVNSYGIEIIPLIYDEAHSFSEELAIVKLKSKYGYIDKTGRQIIPFIYDYAEDFDKGLALVELNNKYGFIDHFGNQIIPIIYDEVDRFEKTVAKVKLNYLSGYVDRNGKEICEIKYVGDNKYIEKDGLLRLSKSVGNFFKYGYIQTNGKIILPVIYDDAFYQKGVIVVSLNGKCGIMNRYGETILPLTYDSIYGGSEGEFFRVKLKDKYGFIDKTGKIKIPLIYDFAESFKYGFARVKLDSKFGYIDKSGKVIIDLLYESAEDFEDGFAKVKLNGKYGFIDKFGNVKILLIYDEVNFRNLNCIIVKLKGKFGIININEEEVVPLRFDDYDWNWSEIKFLVNGKIDYIYKTK